MDALNIFSPSSPDGLVLILLPELRGSSWSIPGHPIICIALTLSWPRPPHLLGPLRRNSADWLSHAEHLVVRGFWKPQRSLCAEGLLPLLPRPHRRSPWNWPVGFVPFHSKGCSHHPSNSTGQGCHAAWPLGCLGRHKPSPQSGSPFPTEIRCSAGRSWAEWCPRRSWCQLAR
jgi:hypothetical protein